MAAKVKVKFLSDFMAAWIEEEMGGMGDLGVSRRREGSMGACQGRHDDEEEKREKFDRGFRFGLVSVLPGEETSGVGAGGCAGREKWKAANLIPQGFISSSLPSSSEFLKAKFEPVLFFCLLREEGGRVGRGEVIPLKLHFIFKSYVFRVAQGKI